MLVQTTNPFTLVSPSQNPPGSKAVWVSRPYLVLGYSLGGAEGISKTSEQGGAAVLLWRVSLCFSPPPLPPFELPTVVPMLPLKNDHGHDSSRAFSLATCEKHFTDRCWEAVLRPTLHQCRLVSTLFTRWDAPSELCQPKGLR